MNTKSFLNKFGKKSFISLSISVIVVVIAVGLFPAVSHADPDGTSANPYLITTCIELQAIGNDVPVGVYYQLNGVGDTIDCSATSTWNPNGEEFDGFDPMDNFAGVLDGNDNTITGLYLNRPTEEGVGLFKNTESGANIHDLTIEGADITGGYDVGTLVGYSDGELNIENVTVDGTVHAIQYYAGGLVGDMYGNGVTSQILISGSFVTVDVTVDSSYAGGLIGYADLEYNSQLSITDTDVNGHIVVGGESVGGMIGNVEAYDGSEINITDSTWGNDDDSTINGQYYIGGAVGYADIEDGGAKLTLSNVDTNVAINEESTIPSSEFGGLIGEAYQERGGAIEISGGSSIAINLPENSVSDIGGVIGYINADDYWESSGSSVSIDDTTVLGTIVSTSSDVGGFVGYWDARDSSLSITNSTSNINLTGDYSVGGIIGEYYMYGASSLILTGTDAGGADALVYGSDQVGGFFGYAEAWHGATTTITDSHANYGTEGQIISEGDEQGDWCEGLNFCTGGVGGMYGHNEQRFGSNMTISDSSADVNINLTDIRHIGGLFGYSTIRYDSVLTIDDGSYIDGSITSASDGQDIWAIGGFFGDLDSRYSTLNILGNSYNNANITATDDDNSYWNYDIGGLIGYAYSSDSPFNINITDVSNTGDISTGEGGEIGGFIGYSDSDSDNGGTITIATSTNSGDISNDSENGWDVGGFIGESDGYAISISDSTVTSDTISGYANIGGFAGYASVENGDEFNVTGSSWEGDSSVISAPDGYVGGIIGELDLNYKASVSINESSATGTIESTEQEIGGLIGEIYQYSQNVDEIGSLDITDSFSNVTIAHGNSYIGGLVGEIYSEGAPFTANITDSNSEGTIGNSGDLSQITGGSGDGSNTGGLVGVIDSEDSDVAIVTLNIDGSSSSGDISGQNGYMGGLVGYVYYGMLANISNSFSSGDITTDDGFSGGLVGDADGDVTITTSYATGDVAGDTVEAGYYIGGLVGDSDGILSIDNSFATGDVVGLTSIGGLVGWADTATIDHSYASGDVTAYGDGNYEGEYGNGGLVGFIGNGTVSNSFAAGAVSDTLTTFLSGLVGQYIEGDVTLSNNFYDADRTGQANCSFRQGEGPNANNNEGECEGVNGAPVEVGANYFFGDVTGNHPFDNGEWNFETIWKTNTGAYPTLIPTYHITASAGPHGTISPSGIVSVAEGDDQAFTISANDGYTFGTLTVDGESVLATDSYPFTNVTQNHTIHATFVSTEDLPVLYTLTVNTSGSGTGTIIKDPTGTNFADGTDVTVTAVAAAKSTFKNWSGCSSATTTSITITMDEDKTCTATFSKAGSSGGGSSGGSVSPKVTPPTVPLVAIPTSHPSDCASGYLFSPTTGQSCGNGTPAPQSNNNPAPQNQNNSCPLFGTNAIVKLGTKNPNVSLVQQAINHMNASIPALVVDGQAGQATIAGIMKAQIMLGISADGVWGPGTQAAYTTWAKGKCTGVLGASTSVISITSGTRVLKQGMSGDDVKALQLALIEKNTGSSALALASIGANGNFGPVTLQAVIEFQSAQGLDADGVVGSATMVALGI